MVPPSGVSAVAAEATEEEFALADYGTREYLLAYPRADVTSRMKDTPAPVTPS